ncbi:MAG: hypothetical protein FWC73_02185 [Defluviitaleaceae bacterium]|nr:hypothetical protein [Defluviitaleaceae bacterium]
MDINYVDGNCITEQSMVVEIMLGLCLPKAVYISDESRRTCECIISECIELLRSHYCIDAFHPSRIIIHFTMDEKFLKLKAPIFGASCCVDNHLTIVIVSGIQMSLFRRVFMHEYIHICRLSLRNIITQAAYLEHIKCSLSVLYEEIVAISFEKYLLNCSWKEVSNISYNKIWEQWDSYGLYKLYNNANYLKKLDSPSKIVYFANYIAKSFVKEVDLLKLFNMNHLEGLSYLYKKA